MKIAIVFSKNGRIHFTTSSNNFHPNEKTDDLVNDLYRNFKINKKKN